MKTEQLNAIKERVEKATPGPWKLCSYGIDTSDRKSVLWATTNEDINGNKEDVEFVLNAQVDTSTLIAEVERLYEQIAKERKEHLLKMYDLIGEADKKLVEENNRLREALEFYASTKTYETDVVSQWEPVTLINHDLGEKARQALEGEPND